MNGKRVTAMIVPLVMIFALVTSQEAEARRRKVTDEWSAFAPLPMPRQCWTIPELEGVTKESHHFAAKFHGHLEVTMTEFLGNWDLFVVSKKTDFENGAVIGYAQTSEEEEHLRMPLRKGWKVNILACNYGGGPSAELSLEFVQMRKCELQMKCSPKA